MSEQFQRQSSTYQSINTSQYQEYKVANTPATIHAVSMSKYVAVSVAFADRKDRAVARPVTRSDEAYLAYAYVQYSI